MCIVCLATLAENVVTILHTNQSRFNVVSVKCLSWIDTLRYFSEPPERLRLLAQVNKSEACGLENGGGMEVEAYVMADSG